MMFLAVLLFTLVAVSHGEVDQLIVNGERATYGDHFYICSLQYQWGSQWYHSCGSVIWNNAYVVTAAHCLSSGRTYRVMCGLHRLNNQDDYQIGHIVQSFIIHPEYNGNGDGFPNDIALLRLAVPFDFGREHLCPGRFATSGSFTGQKCKLSGWGRTIGGGSLANYLKKVNMDKISESSCRSKWSPIRGAAIFSSHICFYEPGKSACNGDSGGPVRCGNLITGVTSWGISTCDGSYPSVYTRVSSFYNWLVSIAGPNNYYGC